MYQFVVHIQTYNRSEQFAKILKQLSEEQYNHQFKVLVLVTDDCSNGTHDYAGICDKFQVKNQFDIEYCKNPENFGRDFFYMNWHNMIQKLRGKEFKRFIAIPDDHILCADFLKRVDAYFWRVRKVDIRAVAMNILVNSYSCWGLNRFIDGAFIARRDFFECLQWRVKRPKQVRPECNKVRKDGSVISSGVGQWMTVRLCRHPKWRIAGVRQVSFLKPLKIESMMFPIAQYPNRPKVWGRSARNFVDNGRAG